MCDLSYINYLHYLPHIIRYSAAAFLSRLLNKIITKIGVQVVGVSKMLVHPSFSPSSTTASDNLALVRLVNTARRRYRALCLPTQDSSVTGEVELVGWRISSVVGSLSQSLVSLKTTIVPDCGAGEERLCTSEDTRCQGDTGAPLVKSDNTLVGAMTGGTGCSKYDYGVFTKISSRFLGNQYISYCSTI